MKSNVIPAGLRSSSEQPRERKETKQEVNEKDQEVKPDLYLFQDVDNKSFHLDRPYSALSQVVNWTSS